MMGAPGAKDRPTVLLLHGFMGTGLDWIETARNLAPAFRCLLPDLPGHDGRPLDLGGMEASFEAYTDWLWHTLEPALPRHFALAGYSLGGRLALDLACRFPERVSALILESAHPGLSEPRERRERARHDEDWARRFENGPWPAVLAHWYRQPVFASLTDAQRDSFIARRARHSPQTLARVLRATNLARQPDRWHDLPRLPMPIAFIAGAEDPKFCTVGERMARMLPELTLVKLDGVGHNCHATAPAQVAAVIHRLCTIERTPS
ncbi:2-succinyl-6-hydroxy-2,4-cyclohexadiene-1- carboxylate synthase [Thioalkalivibrio nitratireducens DSM 14787]|uniref:Putative 2-succinyl-6-hydroxy-2,4-cyclohexadiene-1-carboxylate synthase n=1 Tax=Thioalkalivibrio nitratireducens (strain DSM 14787 / UNIQEM 213 / ALEN2) TaxID=1255043 RepID=L0DY77_THIND|nr:2-succinyl-6-hydroxy-2,4-cyclohexadiene-1-carboxylate synthase [Thioalkalivibrio nitratireducens]AGA33326.1 2-succinyl-6-hydroxy-2,4-cyclohexadiene-1- carboxylate synthase [Thioalkalivibrio nitratireducens DSM 14787]